MPALQLLAGGAAALGLGAGALVGLGVAVVVGWGAAVAVAVAVAVGVGWSSAAPALHSRWARPLVSTLAMHVPAAPEVVAHASLAFFPLHAGSSGVSRSAEAVVEAPMRTSAIEEISSERFTGAFLVRSAPRGAAPGVTPRPRAGHRYG